MRANELRIGNYVNVVGYDRIIRGVSQYNQRQKTQTVLHYFEFDKMIPIKIIHLKPIKINKNWLLGFGFERDKLTFNWKLSLNEFYFIELMRIDDEYSVFHEKKPQELFAHSLIRIKHVHQLQNLYFALTNKELTKQ